MQKVSITSDATLWAELAKCRHENFCSQFLRVASVESTRIYEKLVAKKVKDTPQIEGIINYTVGHKKRAIRYSFITLRNVGRF